MPFLQLDLVVINIFIGRSHQYGPFRQRAHFDIDLEVGLFSALVQVQLKPEFLTVFNKHVFIICLTLQKLSTTKSIEDIFSYNSKFINLFKGYF